jgi:hypothetical protein
LWALMLGEAWGGDFVVETPPMKTRVEALRQLRAVVADGYNARLIKRYRHGVGFEFVVILPGFQTPEEAKASAESLSAVLGSSLGVYEPNVNPDGQTAPDVSGSPGAEVLDLTRTGLESVYEQLRWVAQRDAFVQGLEAARQVDFQFRWTEADKPSEHRSYARDLDYEFAVFGPRANRLELWLEPDGAWLRGPNGHKRAVDRGYARSLIRAQSPRHVLGTGMRLLWEVLEPDLAPVLTSDGVVEVSGTMCYLLRAEVGPSQTPLSLAFDVQRLRLRQLVVGPVEKAWVVELTGYHEEVNGLNIPHAISVWFGDDILYRIDIDTLNIVLDNSLIPAAPVGTK